MVPAMVGFLRKDLCTLLLGALLGELLHEHPALQKGETHAGASLSCDAFGDWNGHASLLPPGWTLILSHCHHDCMSLQLLVLPGTPSPAPILFTRACTGDRLTPYSFSDRAYRHVASASPGTNCEAQFEAVVSAVGLCGLCPLHSAAVRNLKLNEAIAAWLWSRFLFSEPKIEMLTRPPWACFLACPSSFQQGQCGLQASAGGVGLFRCKKAKLSTTSNQCESDFSNFKPIAGCVEGKGRERNVAVTQLGKLLKHSSALATAAEFEKTSPRIQEWPLFSGKVVFNLASPAVVLVWRNPGLQDLCLSLPPGAGAFL